MDLYKEGVSTKGETEIALTDLADHSYSGIYFVHIITCKQSVMTRVIKGK